VSSTGLPSLRRGAQAPASAGTERERSRAVIGARVCGADVVAAAAAARWNASRPGCQATCVDAAAGLSLPSQYYWAAGDWGACTAACGGGQQLRAATCMDSVGGA